MKTEELKKRFWEKFNNCYYVVHEDYPRSLFMYYDEKFIRKIKLYKITGEKIIETPNKPSGVCLFEQDYKDGYFYIDYDEMISFFYKNYSSNWQEIRLLVDSWLKESDKVGVLTTIIPAFLSTCVLKESDKVGVLTTIGNLQFKPATLKESDKVGVLTTSFFIGKGNNALKKSDKVSVLTTQLPSSAIYPLLKKSNKVSVLTTRIKF